MPKVPKADIVEEATSLVGTAMARNLSIRVMGGVAVYLRCKTSAERPELAREYKDIDVVASKKATRGLEELFSEAGYTSHRQFNALNGSSRMLFFDTTNNRQVDVFLGRFSMCHALDLEPRIELPGPALSPSDLLLLKLQIVQLNAKDITDSLALLLSYEPKASDGVHHLSTDYIGKLCASDWGWYTTLRDNLAAVAESAATVLSAAEAATVQQRVGRLVDAIDTTPKSIGWKLRDRVGRRKVWYELPEEVQR